jgi:hypothetical protein
MSTRYDIPEFNLFGLSKELLEELRDKVEERLREIAKEATNAE